MTEQTVIYKGQKHPVIPDIDDAVEEYMTRKAKGEKNIAIVDASFYSNKTGYFIAEMEKPSE